MTTTQLQLRRDTTTNIDGITPAQGEPIYDVTRKALVLGDGVTAGGLCVTPFSGTWTPTLLGTGTAGSPTYVVQEGNWVQNGPLMTVWFYITVTALGGMAGNLEIGGLPVVSAAGQGERYAGSLALYQGITLDSGFTQLGIDVGNGGATGFDIWELGSNKTPTSLPVANLASTVTLIGSVTYLTAQPTG
jgi:Major tropism determinant N-terminal domain